METKNILTNPSYNMALLQVFKSLLLLQIFLNTFIFIHAAPLFREYIGAEDKNVKFSDVPINSNVDFHFILSFALDYTDSRKPKSTNGDFRVNWDSKNLSPAHVSEIKKQYPNVKVAMSLGGDTVGDRLPVEFDALSVESWVKNAETSISRIVKEYDLDGIDIDYEHFKKTKVDTFVECIGTLLSTLKSKKIISFASIAPYDDDTIQRFYLALWEKHGNLIDYVNFQFYAYGKMKSSALFLQYFEKQRLKYKGGKILVSFGTDGSGGLSPKNGFFHACKILGDQGKLYGIFIWSADDSKKAGFHYEKISQDLLGAL